MATIHWDTINSLSLWEEPERRLSEDGRVGEYGLDFDFEDRTWLTMEEVEKLIPALEEWVRAAKGYKGVK